MKKRYMLYALLIAGLFVQGTQAQDTPANALKNVTVHEADGSVTKSATIVWRNGVIEEVGKRVNIPFDAYVIDGGDSLHVYPGLIDGYAEWGSPEPPKDLKRLPNPGEPPYDRAGIQPERKPSELLKEDKSFEAATKAGFTTAALIPDGNMLPGQVEIFAVSPKNTENGLIHESIAFGGSFESAPGGWTTGAYPSTLMGVMAKFRQTMFEAKALKQHMEYYQQNPEMTAPQRDKVLETLFSLLDQSKPLYFVVDSKEDIERLFKLQDQFGFDVVIVSGKEAHAKADELNDRNIPVLASVDFTDAPEWYVKSKKKDDDKDDEDKKEEEEDKEKEELTEEEKNYRERQLAAWKAEVTNIKKLLDAGVQVGYASNGMKLKDLNKKVKTLLDEGGLSENELLELMTLNTAGILGIDKAFGDIEKGKNASFSVFDKEMTEKKAKVLHSISNGEFYEFN
ncbi:MAG: amidohydrolase family protein [Balneolaceae bacterium]|nr:amidohydrolase family protein [Balneolaceae bacterium]